MRNYSSSFISIKRIIIVFIIISILASTAYYSFQKWKKNNRKETPTINIATVEKNTIETSITGKGTLSPKNQYEVKSLVKGKILEAPFEDGSQVKKGDLLYKISTKELQNGIETAKLALHRAEKTYTDSVKQKQDLVLTSKVSGYIRKLMVKSGDTIQSGSVIAEIYNSDKLYIEIPFPSQEVKRSFLGKKATLFMDISGEKVTGTVKSIRNMEEVLTGGILIKKVTIELKNPGGIKDGDLAEGSIGSIMGTQASVFHAAVETNIVAETSGKLTSLSIKEGEFVNENSKIGTLSSKELENQIQSNLLNIEESKLSLKAQEDQLDNYEIKSPISGQVITKNIKKGDTIDPSSNASNEPLTIIYDLSVLTFQMDVDELDIRNISIGQKVMVTAGAYPDKTYYGTVEKISLKSTTNNGVSSYPVTIKIKKYGKLLPGMNVTGTITTGHAENVLTIPSEALIDKNLVYLKKDSTTPETSKKHNKGKNNTTDSNTSFSNIPDGFEAVKIKTGLNDGANIEIKSGLKEGDNVYIPFINAVGQGIQDFNDMYGQGEAYNEDFY